MCIAAVLKPRDDLGEKRAAAGGRVLTAAIEPDDVGRSEAKGTGDGVGSVVQALRGVKDPLARGGGNSYIRAGAIEHDGNSDLTDSGLFGDIF
jgi:hypothetical protein